MVMYAVPACLARKNRLAEFQQVLEPGWDNHGLELVERIGRLVVDRQPIDHRRTGPVGVADQQTLGVAEVERGPGEQIDVLGGHDHLQPVDGAHLVAERSFGGDLERQVVTEVLPGVTDDLQPQTQSVGLGLGVAQLDDLLVRGRSDADDRLDSQPSQR
ncbi:MAG TPA: hypothetical protein PLV68_18580 [Ilumatobacteraceae bacterium]|nr:hypothetical protein [Ilumatobacteraceae bacterium]